MEETSDSPQSPTFSVCPITDYMEGAMNLDFTGTTDVSRPLSPGFSLYSTTEYMERGMDLDFPVLNEPQMSPQFSTCTVTDFMETDMELDFQADIAGEPASQGDTAAREQKVAAIEGGVEVMERECTPPAEDNGGEDMLSRAVKSIGGLGEYENDLSVPSTSGLGARGRNHLSDVNSQELRYLEGILESLANDPPPVMPDDNLPGEDQELDEILSIFDSLQNEAGENIELEVYQNMVSLPRQIGGGYAGKKINEDAGNEERIVGGDVEGGDRNIEANIPGVGGEQGRGFNVQRRDGRINRRLNVAETLYVVTLDPRYLGERCLDHLDLLSIALENVLQLATGHLHDDDLIRVYINQTGLDTPIRIPLRPKSETTVITVLEAIEKTLQSHQFLKFTTSFELHIATIILPRGGTRTRVVNIARDLAAKTSVVLIYNSDGTCLARAIAVCYAKLIQDADYDKIRRRGHALQRQKAEELCALAGVPTNTALSILDIPKFERCLQVQIRVVSPTALNKLIYTGDKNINTNKFIYLYHNEEHFDAITNIGAFYAMPYYCHGCMVPFTNLQRHKCPGKCDSCWRFTCVQGVPIRCTRCNRRCRNKDCFTLHRNARKNAVTGKALPSICNTHWLCKKCDVLLPISRSKSKHQCGEKLCRQCQVYFLDDDHLCYISPLPAQIPGTRYIYFDVETDQSSGTHIPNFIAAHKTCEDCMDIEDINIPCAACPQRKFIFSGKNCVNDFCVWLFSGANKSHSVMAHNLKNFDGHFILKYLVDNGVKPSVILNGNKIMYLQVAGYAVKMIDTLNHMPIALSKLPKAFGIEGAAKGYFPYLFNTEANAAYVGCIPDPYYYGPDQMHESDREVFLKWHAAQKANNVVFDMQYELAYYCENDVDVLRKASLRYRKLMLECTVHPVEGREPHGVDPLCYVTGASAAFAVQRHAFIKPETIASVPAEGITSGQYSKISIAWLEWLMYQASREGRTLRLQHGVNSREKMCGKYRLDGFDPDTNTAYEFLGCKIHGHRECTAPSTPHPYDKTKTMSDLHEAYINRLNALERKGLTVVSIYECHFKKQMALNAELREFVSRVEIPERLDPRDAFFGGRTNAFKLYHEVSVGEEIKYLDFNSLYPSVLKSEIFPIGYPDVITRDFSPLEKYLGFAKVTVLPPRKLLLPLLPVRVNGRLMFPLCMACCLNEQASCDHSDQERAITGTWVTLELNKAIELGYEVQRIYEVYHFPRTVQRDTVNDVPGLLSGFIDTFLKIKQESSGWPAWVLTDSDKQNYLREYFLHEGIHLDPDKICVNPGLRYIAKNLLNSSWGKFAQRNNLKRSTFAVEPGQFYEIVCDETKLVLDVHVLNENVVLLEWEDRTHFQKTSQSSNIFLAGFTTAHGRLKLYSVMETLQENLLYVDTDSCILVSRPGSEEPPTGDYLGDLVSEFPQGNYATIFGAGGAKNYFMILNNGEQIMKIRGFSLTYQTKLTLNVESVMEMVKNIHSVLCTCVPTKTVCGKCSPYITVTNDRKICRALRPMRVYNRVERKDYRVVYSKRVLRDDFTTLPYGY